jgi:acyl carrier protein
MTLAAFIQDFEAELQLAAGTVSPSMPLAAVPRFDSMGRLSLLSMVDAKYGVALDADALDRCPTVAALHATIAAAAK